VSPQWRDEIGIFLSPHKLALTRLARGVRPTLVGETGWVNEVPGDTDWGASLSALDALLAQPAWQRAVARVVISDHWVRYAIVPYAAALSGEAERKTHARHVLTSIYGDVVGNWSLSLSEGPPGAGQVVCALPANLLEELQLLLLRHHTPMKSLQPQLVAAYNHWRGKLPDGGAWFVSMERGSLAAARLVRGGWDRVHSVRIGADWAVELRRLQTFGRLASNSPGEGRVYVDAPTALRLAAGETSEELVWLEDEPPGIYTAGRLEFLRRHQA